MNHVVFDPLSHLFKEYSLQHIWLLLQKNNSSYVNPKKHTKNTINLLESYFSLKAWLFFDKKNTYTCYKRIGIL